MNLTEALSALPPWRREQALRFRSEQSQRLCAAVYLLLCKALQSECGITEQPEFAIGETGKPLLKQHPGIWFNLSHSHDAAACVIADVPVGIDIELIRPIKASLAKYTMNEDECRSIGLPESSEALLSGIASQRFFEYWTKKEAYLKMTGEGIHNHMQSVLDTAEAVAFRTIITKENYIYTTALRTC